MAHPGVDAPGQQDARHEEDDQMKRRIPGDGPGHDARSSSSRVPGDEDFPEHVGGMERWPCTASLPRYHAASTIAPRTPATRPSRMVECSCTCIVAPGVEVGHLSNSGRRPRRLDVSPVTGCRDGGAHLAPATPTGTALQEALEGVDPRRVSVAPPGCATRRRRPAPPTPDVPRDRPWPGSSSGRPLISSTQAAQGQARRSARAG